MSNVVKAVVQRSRTVVKQGIGGVVERSGLSMDSPYFTTPPLTTHNSANRHDRKPAAWQSLRFWPNPMPTHAHATPKLSKHRGTRTTDHHASATASVGRARRNRTDKAWQRDTDSASAPCSARYHLRYLQTTSEQPLMLTTTSIGNMEVLLAGHPLPGELRRWLDDQRSSARELVFRNTDAAGGAGGSFWDVGRRENPRQ